MSTLFTHAAGSHVRVGDADLYFERLGNPGKPALLLLHGGLGSVVDFNPVASELLPDFHLVGIDTRGHGRSSLGSAPLTFERCETDVLAVLRHLDIERFSVLGFSDGGIVGYRLAAHHPERVTSVVTVGAQWRLSAGEPVFELLAGLTPEMWDEMSPDARPQYEAVNPVPDFPALVRAAVALWTDLQPSGYPGDHVRRIVAPTLVVRGDSDPLLSLAEAAQLQTVLPAASILNVPFAGHEVHLEAQQLFVAALKDFLVKPRKRDAGA